MNIPVSDLSVTILERVKFLLEGWRNANHKQNPVSQNHTTPITSLSHHYNQNTVNGDIDVRWRKLRSYIFKCNVDTSLSNTSNKVELSMCIRDSAGNHVRSKTMWLTPSCSVDIEEALGLYHAIRWIHELQLANVDFGVDSKNSSQLFQQRLRRCHRIWFHYG